MRLVTLEKQMFWSDVDGKRKIIVRRKSRQDHMQRRQWWKALRSNDFYRDVVGDQMRPIGSNRGIWPNNIQGIEVMDVTASRDYLPLDLNHPFEGLSSFERHLGGDIVE